MILETKEREQDKCYPISIHEAADMLGITEGSLLCELEKADCPYGFCVNVNGCNCYYVSRSALEQLVENQQRKDEVIHDICKQIKKPNE